MGGGRLRESKHMGPRRGPHTSTFCFSYVVWNMCKALANKRLKTMEKVVAVAHKRWLFMRSSNDRAFTGKILVFWISGRLWELAAYKRWSHLEVLLQCQPGVSF